MTYLLDSNACIALINGKPAGVRFRFQRVIEKGAHVNVSAIVIFELWYGVAKSIYKEGNANRLEIFLRDPSAFCPSMRRMQKPPEGCERRSKRRVSQSKPMIC